MRNICTVKLLLKVYPFERSLLFYATYQSNYKWFLKNSFAVLVILGWCIANMNDFHVRCYLPLRKNFNLQLSFSFALCAKCTTFLFRVATAQGKQGIWLLTFPDRENTGNLVNLIFYAGKIVATLGKF